MWKLCCGPSPVVQQAHQASEPAPAAPAAAAIATTTATTAPLATAAPKVDQNAAQPMQEITPKPAEAPVPEPAVAASAVPEVILSPTKEEQPAPATVAEPAVVASEPVVQKNAPEPPKPNPEPVVERVSGEPDSSSSEPVPVESAKLEPVQQAVVESSSTPASKKPVVFIIMHSMWGHVKTLAESISEGLVGQGCEVKLYRVAETLSDEVLAKMYAQKFEDIPLITTDELTKADGFLVGFGTRFGSCSAQMKAFWDSTGSIWQQGGLSGKYGGCFTSSASQHGGQETTIATFLSHFVHHGIIYVPLGYGHPGISGTEEVFGGGPWGAGTISASDGSRLVSDREKLTAKYQGENFGKLLKRAVA
ncbi:hypothetical protein HDU78_009774 [Chytriomyces hyalinus]|nr:hypothetical protein HDU78_009774 [Chytriomyces hyalinus]